MVNTLLNYTERLEGNYSNCKSELKRQEVVIEVLNNNVKERNEIIEKQKRISMVAGFLILLGVGFLFVRALHNK